MPLSLARTLTTAAAILALSAMPAFAEQLKFHADLSGAHSVPPTETKGTGKLDATLDTNTKAFSWDVTYSNLTGEATAAHFHGPAAENANADPVVPLEGSLKSPIKGHATLTDEQINDLKNGKWYLNIHTQKYPDGEIRGQVKEAK